MQKQLQMALCKPAAWVAKDMCKTRSTKSWDKRITTATDVTLASHVFVGFSIT